MDNIFYNLGLAKDSQISFKDQRSLEERTKLFQHIRQTQPGFVLIICEPHKYTQKSEQENANLNNTKLLLSERCYVRELTESIRGQLKFALHPTESLYLFAQNTILQQTQTIQEIYKKYADKDDGLLYIKYARSDFFG